jgi:hypothetical protein
MIDLSQAQWKKASRSTSSGGGCVEVAGNFSDVTAIRDSKNPHEGAHVIERSAFAAFLGDVKAGRYDI